MMLWLTAHSLIRGLLAWAPQVDPIQIPSKSFRVLEFGWALCQSISDSLSLSLVPSSRVSQCRGTKSQARIRLAIVTILDK